jgi:hypothetical protein
MLQTEFDPQVFHRCTGVLGNLMERVSHQIPRPLLSITDGNSQELFDETFECRFGITWCKFDANHRSWGAAQQRIPQVETTCCHLLDDRVLT